MALILPEEARETPARLGLARGAWSPATARSGGSCVVDVRQSMANGGGPACLRLRVVADPATVDPRFLVDEAKLDRIAGCIEAHWPEQIAPADLADPALWARIEAARARSATLLGSRPAEEPCSGARPFLPAKEKRHARQVEPPSRKPPAPLCRPSAATRRRAS